MGVGDGRCTHLSRETKVYGSAIGNRCNVMSTGHNNGQTRCVLLGRSRKLFRQRHCINYSNYTAAMVSRGSSNNWRLVRDGEGGGGAAAALLYLMDCSGQLLSCSVQGEFY